MDDTEQLDQISHWWNQYKNKIIAILGIIALAYFGGKYWIQKQDAIAQAASSHYEEFIISIEANEHDAIVAQGKNILEQFKSSPYASLAALHLAKYHAEKNELESAVQHLNWVINNTSDNVMLNVAKTRLSAIYIGQQKPDEVIALWKDNDSAGYYAPVFNELLGDAYLIKQDRKKAYEHYKKAYDLIKENNLNHFVLGMKLDNLADQATE